MKVNKYRDLCRKLINDCRHPELTHARKRILSKLVDYINDQEGFTAWPSFDTLAAELGVHRTTVIRAINAGRKASVLKRIYKGGKTHRGGTSNRYRFNIDLVAGQLLGDTQQPSSTPAPDLVAGVHQPSSRRATQSSNYNLKDNLRAAPPSSSSCNSSSVVANSEDSSMVKEGVGERGPTAPKSEPDYRDIKKAILSFWPVFSATSATRHMRIYGSAKTLEVVECAARLRRPDINAVLDAPLMDWSAPVMTEVEYTPALRELYEGSTDEVYIPGPVPQRYFHLRSGTLTESGLSACSEVA